MRRTIPLSRRFELQDASLRFRLTGLLPRLMEESGLNMWVVLCREYNEDPVYLTLVPALCLSARRLSCLVFCRDESGFQCFSLGKPDARLDPLYQNAWTDSDLNQWQALRQLIDRKNPRTIGIDVSPVCAMSDGLSKQLYDELCGALSEEQRTRLTSAYPLVTRWLETRTETELARYQGICTLAADIMAEAFSPAVILPGVTTTGEVERWVLDECNRLGLSVWFSPDVDIQRRGKNSQLGGIILPGDLLHYDMGICYMGLCTDNQRMAYVLRPGEQSAPAGIERGVKGSLRFQDIVAEEHRSGRTGNEILRSARTRAQVEGLDPCLYCHPLGVFGHSAGMTVGLWDHQEGVPGRGDWPLHSNTCYALELNTQAAVPEWNGQPVRFMLEESVAFTEDGRLTYLADGRDRLALI